MDLERELANTTVGEHDWSQRESGPYWSPRIFSDLSRQSRFFYNPFLADDGYQRMRDEREQQQEQQNDHLFRQSGFDASIIDLNANLSGRFEILEQRMSVNLVRLEKLENLHNDLLQRPAMDTDMLERSIRDGIEDYMKQRLHPLPYARRN
ncbi:unnamed protein product, partial [Prorocentrum cordatum]